MKNEGHFSTLQQGERIVVTGATGWMGRELISRLLTFRPDIKVLPIVSQSRTFAVGGRVLEASAWDDQLISRWKPTAAVHLAFLTRELEESLGTAEYERRNRQLTARAETLYGIPTLKFMVIASSGAAVTMKETSYGKLKSEEEERFTLLGHQAGLPTVIARIWSVSGALCPKPGSFALYDLIGQTRLGPRVRIRATHEVRRRYVDAGEYLEACLSAGASDHDGIIDSGGPEVEIGELAIRIQEVLGIQRPIDRPSPTGAPDEYLSKSLSMEQWARDLGICLSDLRHQIRKSAEAVTV